MRVTDAGTVPVLAMLNALPGCLSTEPAVPEASEGQAVAISKALYDALEENPAAVLDPAIPWPDDYLRPSATYDECMAHAAAWAEADGNPLLDKALQLCERRHLDGQ